jgi:acetyltransferase-like isoleucine patch superfamily enzyme
MQATSSAVYGADVESPEAAPVRAVEEAPPEAPTAPVRDRFAEGPPSRLGDQLMPLRLFGVRVLNYLTNHVVNHVPSFTLRHLWYRIALGIEFGEKAGVFLGTYIWFYGPRASRRTGVTIGRNSLINRGCTIDIRSGLTIGENVSISPEVMILGGTHDINDPHFGSVRGRVVIEDYAFIGSRATIFHGVTIGRGAVVAAGSLVSKDVPPMTVVAGAPARPIGMRDPAAAAYELGTRPLFE